MRVTELRIFELVNSQCPQYMSAILCPQLGSCGPILSLYTDIYDEEIWKTFPSSTDNSAEQRQFFTPNTADSHLGIMINLDWFQPFDSASYSTGAIYGVICNL